MRPSAISTPPGHAPLRSLGLWGETSAAFGKLLDDELKDFLQADQVFGDGAAQGIQGPHERNRGRRLQATDSGKGGVRQHLASAS